MQQDYWTSLFITKMFSVTCIQFLNAKTPLERLAVYFI